MSVKNAKSTASKGKTKKTSPVRAKSNVKKKKEVNYFDVDAVSQSFLKTFLYCQYWAQESYITKTLPRETSQAMQFGSALDKWLTENPTFWEEYAVVSRRSKEMLATGKNAEGKVELTNTDHTNMTDLAELVEDQPLYKKHFQGKSTQKEIFYTYVAKDGTKIPLKAKLDYFSEDTKKAIIADLKACQDGSYAKFKWTIQDFNYDFQLAFYRLMVRWEKGKLDFPTDCYNIAAGRNGNVRFYEYADKVLKLREEQIIMLLEAHEWTNHVKGCKCSGDNGCPFYKQKEFFLIDDLYGRSDSE